MYRSMYYLNEETHLSQIERFQSVLQANVEVLDQVSDYMQHLLLRYCFLSLNRRRSLQIHHSLRGLHKSLSSEEDERTQCNSQSCSGEEQKRKLLASNGDLPKS